MDINTAIAISKGWVFYPDEIKQDEFWRNPKTGESVPHKCFLPDYEHDANLYMALFEEMVNENKDCHVEIFWNPGRNNFVCWIIEDLEEGGPRDFDAESTDKGTAVCLCFCKWKGIEVVG